MINDDLTWFNNLLEEISDPKATLGYGNAIMPYTDLKKLLAILGRQRIDQWLQQFEDIDRKHAVELLTMIKYYDSATIMNYLRLAFYDWKTRVKSDTHDVRFVGMGAAGKSGQLISYLFRTANQISPSKFLYMDQLTEEVVAASRYIVLLDDYIGSGSQASDYWGELVKKIPVDQLEGKIYLIALAGTWSGVHHIEEQTGMIPIVVEKRRSAFQPQNEEDPIVLFLRKYGSGLYTPKDKNKIRQDYYLGWENTGETIAFFCNVPNNSVPILWATSKSEVTGTNWIPLFERAITTNRNINLDLLSVLLEKWEKGQLYAEDYMTISKILVESYTNLRLDEYTCIELLQLAQIAASFYKTNSGEAGGLVIHPLEVFQFLLRIRDEIVQYIAEKTIRSGDWEDFKTLFDCFGLDAYSAKQESFAQHIVTNEICLTLREYPEWEEKVVEMIASEDVYIANGAFRVLQRNVKGSLKASVINGIQNIRNNGSHRGRFFAEHLLAVIEMRAPITEDIDLSCVHMLVNCYGNIWSVPVSEFERLRL